MKVFGRDVPSLGEYLSEKNEKEQAQAELLLMLAPFLAGYAVFLYQWIILWKPIELSVGLPSVIMAFGYILYFKWRDSVRAEAQALNAVVINTRWDEEIKTIIKGVVWSNKSLTSEELFGVDLDPDDLEDAEDPAREMKEAIASPEFKFNFDGFAWNPKLLVGRYYESLTLESLVTNPLDGEKFRKVVVIMDFPFDKTFRKTAGHWFSHKGQLFPIVAGDVDASFVGFNEEEERTVFLRVTSSQERTRLMQIGLGLQPATASIDEVNKARRFESTRSAIGHLLRANTLDAHLEVVKSQFPDAEKDAYRGAFRLLLDLDKLREEYNRQLWEGRLTLRNIIIIVVLLYVGYRVYSTYWLEEEVAALAWGLLCRV